MLPNVNVFIRSLMLYTLYVFIICLNCLYVYICKYVLEGPMVDQVFICNYVLEGLTVD